MSPCVLSIESSNRTNATFVNLRIYAKQSNKNMALLYIMLLQHLVLYKEKPHIYLCLCLW